MEQLARTSETQPQPQPHVGNFSPGADANDQDRDQEGYYETTDDEDEGDVEGDDNLEEFKRDKILKVEQKLADPDFVKQLERNKEKQQQFLEEFGDCLGLPPLENEDNLLHFMVRGRRTPSPFLIRHILSNHKERMDDRDDARRRPLTVAIETKKDVFIKTVLETNYDNADLERILKSKSSDMGNGLHTAIKNGLSPKLTIDLIHKVSNEVLSAEDGRGCTPLHCAVEYERCTEAQLDVVKALLEKGDSALDVKRRPNQSVYRYHFNTRPKEDKTPPKTAAGPKEPSYTDSQPPDSPQEAGGKVDEREAIYEKTDPQKGEEIPSRPSQAMIHNTGQTPMIRRAATFIAGDAAPKPPATPANYQANVSRKATAAPTITPKPAPTIPPPGTQKGSPTTATKVPQSSNRRKVPKHVRRQVAKPPVSIIFADRIANEVKLQYLRSTFKNDWRNHDTAVEFLYGDNQTKHICFNLLEKSKPMNDRSLTKGSYSRFEFDTALQFVAVGPIAVYKQGEPQLVVPVRISEPVNWRVYFPVLC